MEPGRCHAKKCVEHDTYRARYILNSIKKISFKHKILMFLIQCGFCPLVSEGYGLFTCAAFVRGVFDPWGF